MKKISFSALILSALFFTPSCKTSQKAETLSSSELNGKWTIQSVNNQEIKIERTPFMDFMEENRLNAQVGCNIYNSTYTYDATTGDLTFPANGQMTMMACPDMATEDAIVKAIAATKKVEKAESGKCINLLGADGNVLMTLCK
ncbi:MAG: META domain-containing protein [Bacteroidales bacterium]